MVKVLNLAYILEKGLFYEMGYDNRLPKINFCEHYVPFKHNNHYPSYIVGIVG